MSPLALSETAMPPPMRPATATPIPLGLAPPPQSAPSLITSSVVETSATAQRKQISPVALILGAVLLLGVGVALAYGVIRTLRPAPVAVQQPQATATASDVPKIQPLATATETAAQPSATETTALSSTAHTASTRPHNGGARPPATTSATTTQPTAAQPHPTLDIQLTR